MVGVTFSVLVRSTLLVAVGCGAATVERASRGPESLVVATGGPEAPAAPATLDSARSGGQAADAAGDAIANPVAKPPTEHSTTKPGPGGQRACLQYEPAHVVLRGVIRRVTFAGPPNYESVAQGDAPETSWLLTLDEPTCVDASSRDDGIDVARTRVREVQLVLDGRQYARYRSLVGRRVEAVGELFGSHTGHHHTDVLLTVSELRPASRSR